MGPLCVCVGGPSGPVHLPRGVQEMAELAWCMGPVVPTGFLEKNRDMLSADILTLVYSSKNKFLREIFNLESAETKLGHSTIRQAKARNQFFKVGFQHLPGLRGLFPPRARKMCIGNTI